MKILRGIRQHGLAEAARLAPNRIWRRVRRWYYRTTGARAVPSAYGVLMRANWRDHTFELCFNGIYGPFLADLLRSQKTSFVFLDIGANQGLYSLVAATNPHCVHVYAVEPVHSTFRLLKENIELNGLSARITPLQFGISDADATADIAVDPGHSGVASLHGTVRGGKTEQVQLRTGESLAALVDKSDIPLIVKVDVEGHEHVVLSQLAASPLNGRLNAVFYEVAEGRSDPDLLRQVLSGIGLDHSQAVGSGAHYDVLATRRGLDSNA